MPAYPFLFFSLGLLIVWVILWFLNPITRREIFMVSFWTMFLGLTEPIFVPEYWNPPTLFDLAKNTGFDIESLIFAFAAGGIAAVIYESFFKKEHKRMTEKEKMQPRHRWHFWAIISAPLSFLVLLSVTSLNPIYSVAIACSIGFFAAWACRPDLLAKMAVSGVIFLVIYFIGFLLFNLAYPDFVASVWNLQAISGILVAGVPLEELLFAFTFGLYWASLYEHFRWYKLR